MRSFEAMARCIGRDAEIISDALGMEAITLRKWKADPVNGSGARNDLDRLEIVIQSALDLGRDKADAMAPIRYLCDRFDPCHQACAFLAASSIHDLHRAHNRMMREVSDLLDAHMSAVEDGKVTPQERRLVEAEIDHLRDRLEKYRASVQMVAERQEA